MENKPPCFINKLIVVICVSMITFVGINFISCNFRIPGSLLSQYTKDSIKDKETSLSCRDSEKRGHETLLAILTTIIALKTRID